MPDREEIQELTITVRFTTTRHNPGTEEHLREILRSYLAPKGIELQDDLTIEI